MEGVSVIVCFYNAYGRLRETLQSIVDQDVIEGIDWEIIMVDNNSTDGAKDIVEEFKKVYESKVSINYVFEPTPGLSNARTAGFLYSHFEYLLFCDDDNLPAKEYVTLAYKLMHENNSIGMLGGKGFIDARLKLPAWFDNVETAYAVGNQYEHSGNITACKGYVWGAGMVMRRTAWQKVIDNGFQGFLLTGRKSSSKSLAGEDTEMCILIQNAGYEIHYSNQLEFIHAIPQSRLNWDYYKSICKGFAHAQIFVENYLLYFNNNEPGKYSNTLSEAFSKDLKIFLNGCFSLNYYKLMFLEFVRKRPGYTNGFQKRKYFDRITGRIKFAKDLRNARKTISSNKKKNKVFLS